MIKKFENLWEDYRLFLVEYCNLQQYKKYTRIFKILHDITFEYSLERDENRVGDALELLRYNYKIPPEYISYEDEFIENPVSVFEVLVALSIRIEDDIIGDPSDPKPDIFFMDMIRNLEAVGLDDNICNVVNNWMLRKFRPNGYGSPFPVVNDIRDQRELEIWDQANAYIYEYYGV